MNENSPFSISSTFLGCAIALLVVGCLIGGVITWLVTR